MIYQVQYEPTPRYILGGDLPLEIRNESEFLLFAEIYMNHEYRDAVLHLVNNRPKDRPVQIVDLGANVGFFSWYASSAMITSGIPFEITLVEAHPVLYAELMRRLSDVPAIPATAYCGLMGGRKHGRGIFVDDGNHHTLGKIHVPPEGHIVVNHHMNIQYLDPNRILPQGTIDLLKMDIEGSEFDFIEVNAEVLKRTNRLVLEVHHDVEPNEHWGKHLELSGLRPVYVKQTGLVSTQFWVRENIEVEMSSDPAQPNLPTVPPGVPTGYRRPGRAA